MMAGDRSNDSELEMILATDSGTNIPKMHISSTMSKSPMQIYASAKQEKLNLTTRKQKLNSVLSPAKR